MPAHVSEPVTVLPPYKVTTAEIGADVRARHAEHPRLPVFLRVIEGCGVAERYFTRPFEEVVAANGAAHRMSSAFTDAAGLAVEAARGALEHTGLHAAEVDAMITSHTTSWAVPNLDVRLVAELGLRPEICRLPMGSLACAGGAQALIRAADLLKARPGAKVLVVVAEVLSAIYHRDEDSVESMIYKALFGDSAGACVVTDAPLGPGLAVEETFEYVLPDSLDRYWGRVDAAGLHFDSTKKALAAPGEAMPRVLEWLRGWRPSFAVIHPGGPRIITGTTAALGLDAGSARHSLDSLEQSGNLGGNAVLDILRRSHASPPAPGTGGLLLAFGPGFTVAAVRGIWN
ncbi:PhlD [Streptomyces sp. ODS28]|uniref:PhlD n=1 Tax=Streptomyces sp. ODS28 TaxID=3136688 RepID=UPI0031F192DD